MVKQVELNQGSLVLGGTEIDVSGYHHVITGRYSDNDINWRREKRVYAQLGQEGLLDSYNNPDLGGRISVVTVEAGNRRGELHSTLQPDNYTKYIMLIGYSGKVEVDFDQLQQQVSNAIPSELKGSIDAIVHTASDRLIDHSPPLRDGIEIMVSDDVELIVRQ